jgi:hypothetical protein
MNRQPSTPKELNDMESGRRTSTHMLKMTASEDVAPKEDSDTGDLIRHYGYICLAVVALAIFIQALGFSLHTAA